MEKPLIKKNLFDKVRHVYEYDDVCYFHWDIEFGIGTSDIYGIKIPIPFVKTNDIEPIKVIKKNGSNFIIITRFHYDILIFFNQPFLKNNKPVIEFLTGSHSPMVYSGTNNNLLSGFIRKIRRLDTRLKKRFLLLMAIYDKMIEKCLFTEILDHEIDEYPNIEYKSPTNVALLKPESMNYLFWVGETPDKTDLINIRFLNKDGKI